MDPASMKDVPKNMRRTGMLLLRSALMEALRRAAPMCVVHAAQAAEILLKARIAQEHLLLIFTEVPRARSNQNTLTLVDLLEKGRTFSYGDLPDRLLVTTGIKISQLGQYKEFGKLRNQIVHLSVTNEKDLSSLTVSYVFDVIDPLVEEFWGKSVIDFIKNDPRYQYEIGSGDFEDSIRKVYTIDQRLRCLLGGESEAAWKAMQSHMEALKSLESTKTLHDYEAEYEEWQAQSDPEQEAYYQQEIEAQTAWKNFLDSF